MMKNFQRKWKGFMYMWLISQGMLVFWTLLI